MGNEIGLLNGEVFEVDGICMFGSKAYVKFVMNSNRRVSNVTRLREYCPDCSGNLSVPFNRVVTSKTSNTIRGSTEIVTTTYFIKPDVLEAIISYSDGTKLDIGKDLQLLNPKRKRVILNPSKLSASVRENLKYSFTS